MVITTTVTVVDGMEPLVHNPRFSILMAVYNAEAFLEKALQSLLSQSFSDWQLICVDDASTDHSLSLLQRYASQDDRITVIHKTVNEGQAIARNEALRLAQGDYVVMLDADDWLSPDCLELVGQAFEKGEDTDAVLLNLIKVYDDGHEEPYLDGSEAFLKKSDNEACFSDNIHSGSWRETKLSGYDAFLASLDWSLHGLYAVRRDIHLRYPFDTACRLYSDDNTTRLHYLHSRKVAFCEGHYYYRQHAASSTNAFTASRFLFMEANLSMKRTLEREGLSREVLDYYERHRWMVFIGQLWTYHCHHHQLTPVERKTVKESFRRIYGTFTSRPVPPKFGYTWFRSYRLFLLQEKLYFTLRKVLQSAD